LVHFNGVEVFQCGGLIHWSGRGGSSWLGILFSPRLRRRLVHIECRWSVLICETAFRPFRLLKSKISSVSWKVPERGALHAVQSQSSINRESYEIRMLVCFIFSWRP
jgi:hypothetical protein